MVIQTFYPTMGGAENQCLLISKALRERGVTASVLTERWLPSAAKEIVEGIPVRRLGRGGPRLFHSIFFMLSTFLYLIRHSKTYDIIHVHLAASHAIAAAFAGKLLNKKVLVLIGGGNMVGEIAQSRARFFGRLKLRALGILKPHFIILNRDQKVELKDYGLDKAPVTLIPNGVDGGTYYPVSPEKKATLREKLGWNGLVFLYTGRFNVDKISMPIFKNFLKGWSEALDNRKDVFLYMVGEGPLEKDYLQAIEQQGLNESIRILPARKNVSELYQAADIFILPSLAEGLSNSLLEAMSSWLPILASRTHGITDIVRENTHGYLFDPLSAQEIKQVLKKVLADPLTVKKMGENCGATALNYSLNNTVELYMTIYGEKNVVS